MTRKIQGIISDFLYLLRLALCPKILSILEGVPWAAEMGEVYSAVFGLNILLNPLDL